MSVQSANDTSYLSLTSNLPANFNTGYSVMAWIRCLFPTGAALETLIDLGSGGSTNSDLVLLNSGGLTSYCNNAYQNTPASKVIDTAWHHLAMVRESATRLLTYCDGVLCVIQTDDVSARVGPAATLQLFHSPTGWGAGGGGGTNGEHLRLWDRALSQTEILREMRSRRARALAGLRASFPLQNKGDYASRGGLPSLLVASGSALGSAELSPVSRTWRPVRPTIFLPGSAYSVSLSESGTATDALSAFLTAVGSLLESGTAADSTSSSLTAAGALTESGTASDSQSLILGAAGALAESGSATDSYSTLLAAVTAIAETAAATDSLTGLLTTLPALTESGNATDLVASIATLIAALAETVTATESVSQGGASYTLSITETGSATDALTSVLTAIAAMAESGAAGDTLVSSAQQVANLTESGTANATVSAAAQMVASLAESGNAADSIAALTTLIAVMAESGAASDTVSMLLQLQSALGEAGNAVDALTLLGGVIEAEPGRTLTVKYGSRTLTVRYGNRTVH